MVTWFWYVCYSCNSSPCKICILITDDFLLHRSTYSVDSLRSQSSDSTCSEKSTDVRQMNFDSWRENRLPLVRPLEAYTTESFSTQSSSSDATDFSGQLSYRSSSDNVQGSAVPENSMSSFSSHASVSTTHNIVLHIFWSLQDMFMGRTQNWVLMNST